jgi:hypothetical protein
MPADTTLIAYGRILNRPERGENGRELLCRAQAVPELAGPFAYGAIGARLIFGGNPIIHGTLNIGL